VGDAQAVLKKVEQAIEDVMGDRPDGAARPFQSDSSACLAQDPRRPTVVQVRQHALGNGHYVSTNGLHIGSGSANCIASGRCRSTSMSFSPSPRSARSRIQAWAEYFKGEGALIQSGIVRSRPREHADVQICTASDTIGPVRSASKEHADVRICAASDTIGPVRSGSKEHADVRICTASDPIGSADVCGFIAPRDSICGDVGGTGGSAASLSVGDGEASFAPRLVRRSEITPDSSAILEDFGSDGSPDQCNRVAASGTSSILVSGLFSDAMGMVVPPKHSKHPGRACGGILLLQRVKDRLEEPEADDDDEGGIVRRLFFDSMPADCVTIESIRQVFQPTLLKRFLKRVAEASASVEATFHGTRAEYVDSILEQGLTPSMCMTGAYGRGSYVATHSGIAHQYADADSKGRRYMCVVLVTVGSQVVKGHTGEQATVTALDSLLNPTQYCFVDECRLYITHVIVYRVSPYYGYRVGGGWEDPFQRAMSLAITRASQFQRKTGVR